MLHKGIFEIIIKDNNKHETCTQYYTALDSDIFLPTGCYIGLDGLTIICDTGYKILVTLHKQEFLGKIRPMNKYMAELSFNDRVKRGGKVK